MWLLGSAAVRSPAEVGSLVNFLVQVLCVKLHTWGKKGAQANLLPPPHKAFTQGIHVSSLSLLAPVSSFGSSCPLSSHDHHPDYGLVITRPHWTPLAHA